MQTCNPEQFNVSSQCGKLALYKNRTQTATVQKPNIHYLWMVNKIGYERVKKSFEIPNEKKISKNS